MDVLLSRVLLTQIFAFQAGLYQDLVPLYREWKQMQNKYGNFVYVPPRYLCYLRPDERTSRPFVYRSFDYLCLSPRCPDPRFLVLMAVVHGQLSPLLRWLECIPVAPEHLLEVAVRHGHLHLVKYIHEHLLSGSVEHLLLLDIAAAHGHLVVLEYLHAHQLGGCSCNAVDAAAERGFLDIVKFLMKHRTEGFSSLAYEGALHRGHRHVAKFFMDKGISSRQLIY